MKKQLNFSYIGTVSNFTQGQNHFVNAVRKLSTLGDDLTPNNPAFHETLSQMNRGERKSLMRQRTAEAHRYRLYDPQDTQQVREALGEPDVVAQVVQGALDKDIDYLGVKGSRIPRHTPQDYYNSTEVVRPKQLVDQMESWDAMYNRDNSRR